MGSWPALPVAIRTKLSLVEVSPSTVMRLNEASAISQASDCSSSGAMAASVAIKPSMVAMLGWIMPEPRFTGAGVGVAGIDHQRANGMRAGQVLPSDDDRRRAEPVPGERARGLCAGRDLDHQQIVAIGLADAGLCRADAHASNGKE